MRELDDLVLQFGPGLKLLFDGEQTHSFILENGAKQLSPWFTNIALRRYEDALVITEVEPLVAYVLSMVRLVQDTLVGDRLAEFTSFVEQEMARQGAIRVTKASGLFEARRRES
jgi:hypothetical protein